MGYRVRSFRGTQFRQWATARLSEYLVKGFTLDDERLKNPPGPGVPDYFDGTYLLEGAAVRKSDISVAKNYLRESEITELNRVVTMFLDFAEDQARRKKQTFIADWRDRLDDFLRFNDRNILPDLGRVTREQAEKRAEAEYERFSARRRSQREPEAEAQNLRDLEAQAGKLPRKKSRSK